VRKAEVGIDNDNECRTLNAKPKTRFWVSIEYIYFYGATISILRDARRTYYACIKSLLFFQKLQV